MEDKGYSHPLYSLELVPPGQRGPDDPRWAIEVPQGKLMVAPTLRQRGKRFPTATVDTVVATALSRWAMAHAGFARFGLSPAWADNLSHWRGCMLENEAAQVHLQTEGQLASERSRALIDRGRWHFARIKFCGQLSGQVDLLLRGPAPRQRLALIDALRRIEGRLRARSQAADVLSRHGYGADLQAELSQLVPLLQAEHDADAARLFEGRRLGDELFVIRGALLGDVSRLSQVAPRILSRTEAAALQVQRLLRRAPTRRKDSVSAPAAPAEHP